MLVLHQDRINRMKILFVLGSFFITNDNNKVHAIAVTKNLNSNANADSNSATKIRTSVSGAANNLDQWRDFEQLRDTDLSEKILTPFFEERPTLVAQRLLEVSQTLYQARQEWIMTAPESSTKKNEGISDGYETYCEGDAPANLDGRNELEGKELERAIKLCKAVASLGPLSTKIGQTLSQRPDLVGASAARALKRLQTRNTPFDNQLAYSVMHESLGYWDGPLAPGIVSNHPDVNPDGKPYFAKMTEDCIACASLGQVYRATLHNGNEVAVKVQRPDGLALLAKDAQCFRLVFKVRENIEKVKSFFVKPRGDDNTEGGETEAEIRSRQDGTASSIIDRVANDIKQELDYRNEAKNSERFRESMKFIGFVTTPDVVLATSRILMTDWIPGRHLEKLNKEEGLAMTRMAVEACTASICLTGFVHADPHVSLRIDT